MIVSVNYRHAPESRFPAAADDAFAAVRWIADHAAELGGIPGQLVVAGWSAGANIAAVACQLARDAGGPAIAGQVLVTPVVDAAMDRPSYTENAEGYVLTAVIDAVVLGPLRGPGRPGRPQGLPAPRDLSNLPPALVVTAEFDPLRDEGVAFADALAAAGVPVRHLEARGHVHTSLTMVDVVLSGADVRAQISDVVRSFFRAPVPA